MTTVIQQLARLIQRAKYPDKENPTPQGVEKVNNLISEYLPSGSGLDGYIRIDFSLSSPDQVVIDLAYHHMHKTGMYDGWTNHSLIVKPSFDGLNIRVTGRNKNYIKEYLADLFYEALTQEYVHAD